MHGTHPFADSEPRRRRSEEHQHDQEAGERGGRRRGQGGPGGHGGPRGHRGHGHGGSRGFRGAGGWQQADVPSADDAAAWLIGRLPSDWFTGDPTVSIDREEIVVIGELPAPDSGDADETVSQATAEGRIQRFREDTREARIKIADEATARYGRKVAWGASLGDTEVLFTHLAVPAMTRLRHDERRVLDTLVDAGVARSRSDALAWCVKLVGEHTDEWLASLRTAMSEVDKLRASGPDL
jgi:hypothetical protein